MRLGKALSPERTPERPPAPARLVPLTPTPDGFSRDRLLELFTSAPKAFWRHDIDLSLDAAVKMARFAEIAGVQSTFFVMTASPFYNPFSPESGHALETILGCGHQLGLHCDHRGSEPLVSWSKEQALLDIAYQDMFTDQVSFHIPGADVLWKDFTPWFQNAYAPEWRNRYVSDSRGRPITEAVTDDMQIALHPEHWAL